MPLASPPGVFFGPHLLGVLLLVTGVTWILLALHLRLAKAKGWGHPVREQGLQAHLGKEGTPTAAGWAFVPGAASLWFLSGWSLLAPVLLAAGIGLADDGSKLKGRRDGVPARWRLALQVAIGWAMAMGLMGDHIAPVLWPWLAAASLGWYALFHGLAFAAVVNGVNFADGADGLLAATLSGAILGVGAALLNGSFGGSVALPASAYLLLPMVGLLVAWWFYNRHPAKMFMGETGSYLLGAWVFVAAMGDPWILLALATIPLWELLSVVIQVVSFRATGKRVFKMAPFHHHLELSGWSENKLAGTAFVAQFALTFGILYARSQFVGVTA